VSRRLRIDDLPSIALPEQPALSRDGKRCAYVLRELDTEEDRATRSIWCVELDGGSPRPITHGPSDSAPAWSPDGTALAFLRANDGPPQVWLLPADGGEPEQVTTLPFGAGRPVWSPDGARIAFAAATGPEPDPAAPVVADRLDYQADGTGYIGAIRKHLFVVEPTTRTSRQLTRGDWHAGEPAWSPDCTKLAFAAATAPDADLRLRAPLYVIDAGSESAEPQPAAEPQLAGLADGMAVAVSWTGDGDALLAVGWTGEPVGPQGLHRVPLGGGGATDLSAPLDRNVMPGGTGYPGGLPQAAGDGEVAFCVRDRGCTHLYTVPEAGGTPRTVVDGSDRSVSALSVAGQTAAIVLATPTSFGEVATVDLSTGAQVVRTEHGKGIDDVELYTRDEREFTISDGTVVHGWLLRDPDAQSPSPLLLDIHGGPHNAWTGVADEWHPYHQELVARGWAVLLLNPRGSDGYGAAFFTAAIGAWGDADANDFLEPLDQLVAEGIADPERLAVTGYSYGGYMTCYLTSRDARFAAAVAGGVVSDLVSEAGTSDMAHFLSEHELGGPVWDDGGRYETLSPIARVEAVRTPTLVYHGAADVRCPVGQAQQWHTALRELNVPTRLVLYPEASHLFVIEGRPSHRMDLSRRVVDWVEQYAGDGRAPIDPGHWQRRLDELAARHHVPGAALGILRVRPGREDDVVELATGTLNKETGVEATPDSVFQIGSMTKVWTATVVMQLVDEGLLDLDAPLIDVLPELRLADPAVTPRVTMRHLLTHTSGIDGDVFTDTGRGDECLEKYVAQLDQAAQNHPLGATWSYCNSGFSLMGRVIEKLTGGTWDAAIRERLVQPLGLTRTGTLPEEALLHRAAVGHIGEPGTEPYRAPSAWGLPRSVGPAGLISSTVGDVLTWVRMHLTGGRSADGTAVLSEASTAAMTEKEAELPDKYILGDSWGLGWIRFGWDGRRLIGHDGNTLGQAAFLRVLPDEGLAVTLLTNGGNTRDLYEDLYREIFAELAALEMPRPLTPPDEPVAVDVTPYLGRYERASVRLDVLDRDGQPTLRTEVTGPLAALVPETVHEYPMTAVDDRLFVVREPDAQTWTPVTFYDLPTGESYVHFGARATPRVG
jgi:dipeptidyl aminopeptidase/acylaminoacyl peptidase/CubicO group peptidase (beta-lactamase class C family)